MVVRLRLVYATGPSVAAGQTSEGQLSAFYVGPLVEPPVGHCWADRPLREAQRWATNCIIGGPIVVRLLLVYARGPSVTHWSNL